MTDTVSDSHRPGNDEAELHLEYLYGPQWRQVVRIIERAAQLTDAEREALGGKVNTVVHDSLAGLSGGMDGLAGLLAALQGPGRNDPAAIALDTAQQFGRAVSAIVLADLVGSGDFTRQVFDESTESWYSTIGG